VQGHGPTDVAVGSVDDDAHEDLLANELPALHQ
jgi:hypothetical protein